MKHLCTSLLAIALFAGLCRAETLRIDVIDKDAHTLLETHAVPLKPGTLSVVRDQTPRSFDRTVTQTTTAADGHTVTTHKTITEAYWLGTTITATPLGHQKAEVYFCKRTIDHYLKGPNGELAPATKSAETNCVATQDATADLTDISLRFHFAD